MKSIWENDVVFKEFKPLAKDIKADCVVIGGGIAGILTAYELQNRGFKTVLLEADKLCSGATCRTTAKITSQHGAVYGDIVKKIGVDAGKLYYESQQNAIDYIESVAAKSGINCMFKRLPAYIYQKKGDGMLLSEARALNKIGADFEYTKTTELPFEVSGAIKFPNQAQFHPLMLMQRLTQELEIYEKSRVVSIEADGVVTPHGKAFAQYIVDATHYPIMNIPGFYFLRQHQQRVYLLAIRCDKKLDSMYYGCDDGHTFRQSGRHIIIGGEAHRTGNNKKGGCYYNLFKFARQCYPDCVFDYKWSNQDCITHDGIPFIGRYSKASSNLFVATGFNKWGMSSSGVAAQLIADLICDRKNEYESLYTPQRFHVRAGAKKLFVDVGYSVGGLTKGLFSSKDRKCKHLGCRLTINSDENTFECPCHGSQYAKNGKLLHNPSPKSL